MSIDDKIKAILRAPDSKHFYRTRARRGNSSKPLSKKPNVVSDSSWLRIAEPQTAKTSTRSGPKAQPKGSWKEALALHKNVIFRLKKYGKCQREAELLEILQACTPKTRCANAACPKCTFAAQGVIDQLLSDLIKVGFKLDRCLTIVPPLRMPSYEEQTPELISRKVTQVRSRFDQGFEDSGIMVVVGGIDFDFHEFPHGDDTDHCRPHFHGLAFGAEVDPGDARLRDGFPNKGSINRAVQVESYDGRKNWRHYLFKIPNTRKIRTKDESDRWAPTNYQPLRVEQHLQQALILHEIGWAGRIYLRGVDLIEERRGWQFVLTDFEPHVANVKSRRK